MVEVETERHLKLLPLSTIDIYNVFEHIDMLFIDIQQQPSFTVIPILVGSEIGVLGHLWSQTDVILSWLRLAAGSQLKLLLTSILDINKQFEHIDMLSICIQQQPSYTVLPIQLGSNYGVLGHLWSQNDVKSIRHG